METVGNLVGIMGDFYWVHFTVTFILRPCGALVLCCVYRHELVSPQAHHILKRGERFACTISSGSRPEAPTGRSVILCSLVSSGLSGRPCTLALCLHSTGSCCSPIDPFVGGLTLTGNLRLEWTGALLLSLRPLVIFL